MDRVEIRNKSWIASIGKEAIVILMKALLSEM
jgi:hypothetical protein